MTHPKIALEPLKRSSIVGYGAGDAANNLAFTTATMFLLVYYTDVAGITAAAAGTLLLVVRIFDAVSDVVAGRLVDRAYSKRWGKFRPFIMFGSIPLLLLTLAVFHVPSLGEGGTLLYAYLSYAALGLAYSLVNIPYGSLAGAMTQSSQERAKLGSARTVGALLISSTLGIFVAPLMVPGKDLQPIFTTLTIAFLSIGAALYMFCVFTAKERVERSVNNVTVKQSLETLRHNKPLGMLCLSSLALLSGYMGLSTVQLFYFRDVLHRLDLYAWVAGIQLVLTLVMSALMPRLVGAFGKRNIYIGFGLVMMLGGLIVLLSPAGIPLIGTAGVLITLGGFVGVNIVMWALEADTVEYGEWKTGVRTEGIVYSLFSFTRKAGQALGGALAAYAMAWGGYAGGAGEQTAQAAWGIQIGAGALPLVLGGIAVLIMTRYRLTDKVHASIMLEIAERRDQALANAEAAADSPRQHSAHTAGTAGPRRTGPDGPGNR